MPASSSSNLLVTKEVRHARLVVGICLLRRIVSDNRTPTFGRRPGFFFSIRMNFPMISNYFSRAARGVIAAFTASLLTLSSALAAGPVERTAASAASWLAGRHEADGGFSSGFAPGSDVGASADAVAALAAAGMNTSRGADYLAAQIRSSRKLSAGQIAKIALAVQAAGRDARAFAGQDLTQRMLAAQKQDTGVIGDGVFSHSLCMLALVRSGVAVPASAVDALERLQARSGGWAFSGGDKVDVDTTALAVQALIAAGRPANRGAAGRGLGYLHSLQNPDGGFPYQSPSEYGTESNVNSTALVAQAIIASGDQPESWAAARGNPLSYLVRMANASGALGFQASFSDDNVLATAGAIPALLRATTAGR